MIISFAEQPDVVQEFTDNRRLLREALDRIEPSASQTDLTGALELADGFANPARIAEEEFVVSEGQEVELYIFSDGRFRGVEGFSLGNLQPLFLPVGTMDADNLAITAMNTRRAEDRPEQQHAFVQVANFSDEVQQAVVELYLNDGLVDAAELEVPPGDIRSTTFALNEQEEGQLRAQLDLPHDFQDRLTLDNQAYAVLEHRRDGRVLLVTPGNSTLEAALSTERATRLAMVETISPDRIRQPEFEQQFPSEKFDLVIFDQCSPEIMPLANTLFVGSLPPLEEWKKGSSSERSFGPQIIDWDRSHPLLNLIELGNLAIYESYLVRPPSGGRVLIDSTIGPILAIAPRGRYEDAVMGFEILSRTEEGEVAFNTNWSRKLSFPSFWYNILEYFASRETISQSVKSGRLVESRVNSTDDRLEVLLPDGTVRQVNLERPGRFEFYESQQLGVYEVRDAKAVVKRFVVNLFDREESDIRLRSRREGEGGVKVVESLAIGYVDVAAQSPTSPVRRELWKLLLLGTLVVLVLEWYIYNRRVYV